MDLNDKTVEISVVKLAVLCDALHIAQKYIDVKQLQEDLGEGLEKEDSFYATVFTMGLFMAREEMGVIFKGHKEFIQKIRGKDYVLDLIEHYSKLMGEDLKTKKGWSTEELNTKVDELIDTNDKDKIKVLERMMKAKSYEKN